MHPEFVRALRILDAFAMPYAEAWRLLRPVSARLGVARPSYSTVRRILIAERERKRQNADDLDQLLSDLFSGRFPFVTMNHKLYGIPPPRGSAAARPPPRRAYWRSARRSSTPVTGAWQAKRSQT